MKPIKTTFLIQGICRASVIILNGKKKNSPLTADILANLDKDLVSLLRNMMENDVEKRFNIDDVMKHKYFEKVS